MGSIDARTPKLLWSAAGFAPAWGATWAVAWRCAVVTLIPIAVWTCDRLLYDYAPDRAAGIDYEVRTNKLTGSTCLKFRGEIPDGLRKLAC